MEIKVAIIATTINFQLITVPHVAILFTKASSIAIGVKPIPMVSRKYDNMVEHSIKIGNAMAKSDRHAPIRPITPALHKATILH